MNLLEMMDRPIAFQRAFVVITGSTNAALMLSQIVYWAKRTKTGWFYKTREQWMEETGLSRHEQESARKVLVSLKLIEERRAGIPATMHFRLNTKVLGDIMRTASPSSWLETDQQDGEKLTNKMAGNLPTNTETTSESTQGEEKSASMKAQKLPSYGKKASWVGPYIAIWKRCYNGTLHFQKYMKLLSSLQSEHGAELCINAFENYCTHTEVEFASVNRFAETFGRWSKRYEKPSQEEGDRYAKPTRQ